MQNNRTVELESFGITGSFAKAEPTKSNQNDPMTVDKIMKDLDDCRKGQVNFRSYCSLIAGLLIACNEYYVKHMKKR
ncbi:hypothetical protein XELAEV_18040837mg [Xenopus laevis]|uniref:Uncharacterized protein n=1 Tax=Xenopus laevis TaxID=8355 RepID=A0A974H9Q4_XENLA|nr:hypothetical protein XELAEV_18040837mg [Xenopus laevis]